MEIQPFLADPQKRGDGAKSRYSKYSKMYTEPGSELFKNSTRYYHMSRFRNPPGCQMFGMNWYDSRFVVHITSDAGFTSITSP
jgi:hypothetical protein